MKLYAIEHRDGGLYWTSDGWCELRGLRIGDGLWTDRLAAETFEADKHSGTVVTFNLTREPELRVGAMVVPKYDVLIVERHGDEHGSPHVWRCRDLVDGGTYEHVARDLIVLPEEDV